MQISIWELSQQKIYVKFNDNFIKKLNTLMKIYFQSLRKFTSILSRKANKRIEYGACYKWFSNKGYAPLYAVKYFPEIFNIGKNTVEKNIVSVKGPKSSAKLENIKFPITLSEELARIIAHLSGDGSVTKGAISYNNKNKCLINKFEKDNHKVFGRFKARFYIRKGVYAICIPSVIGDILSVFNKSFYHNKIAIPKEIMNSDKIIKKQFISAFFDDEGSICNRIIRLEITGKRFMKQIVSLLKEDFNINVNKIHSRKRHKEHLRIYYVNISGRNDIINFYTNIGFTHLIKQNKLLEKINSYKVIQRKKGHAKKEIIKLLSEKEKNTSELLKETNMKASCLSYHLKKLQNEGLILRIRGGIDRDYKGRILSTYADKWKLVNGA